ncbi:hypothetical protein KAM463_39850 [Aeromonas caviae]|nr:hypothetical protein KAM463_39850 [Aeromonas caviae]
MVSNDAYQDWGGPIFTLLMSWDPAYRKGADGAFCKFRAL